MYGKKTVEERRATFPFSDAKKVLLVAFPDPNMNVVNGDTGETFKIDSLNLIRWNIKFIKSFELPARKSKYYATEIVELNQDKIDSLSHILINYKLKKDKFKEHAIFASGCYTPRNAILFLDANDKILSYIEICFECHRFIQMPKETIINFNLFSVLEESFKMIDLVKDFMKINGIKYGILDKLYNEKLSF